MKKGWQTKTLGEACEMYQPKTISGKDMVEDGAYLVYGANGVIGRYNQFNHEEPQLLITCRGATCGSVNVSAPRSWVTGNAMVVRPKNETLEMRYLEYLFRGGIDISKAITGAAQPQITRTNLEPLEISFPESLPEQQRIVGLLDEAFEGLAAAKANAEKNLQNTRALFESHLQSVFTQRGPGWVEKNLGDLCQIKTGKKDVNEGNPDGKYPFFTCAAAHTFSDHYSFDTEALLVAGNGNVGQVSYYSGKFEAYQRTYVLFDFKGVTAKYLFRVLDKRLSATVSKQKLGNTMPYIKIGMLTDFVVPVPPPKEQDLVAESLSAIAEETRRLAAVYERKLAALEALKKSLLHQAFTGAL
jgi:type I restriction enzyme S subunit